MRVHGCGSGLDCSANEGSCPGPCLASPWAPQVVTTGMHPAARRCDMMHVVALTNKDTARGCLPPGCLRYQLHHGACSHAASPFKHLWMPRPRQTEQQAPAHASAARGIGAAGPALVGTVQAAGNTRAHTRITPKLSCCLPTHCSCICQDTSTQAALAWSGKC